MFHIDDNKFSSNSQMMPVMDCFLQSRVYSVVVLINLWPTYSARGMSVYDLR